MVPIGIYRCQESIAHIFEAWKCSPDHLFLKKSCFRSLLEIVRKHGFLKNRWSGKHFHASKMCAIDSWHRKTPIGTIFRRKFNRKNFLPPVPPIGVLFRFSFGFFWPFEPEGEGGNSPSPLPTPLYTLEACCLSKNLLFLCYIDKK